MNIYIALVFWNFRAKIWCQFSIFIFFSITDVIIAYVIDFFKISDEKKIEMYFARFCPFLNYEEQIELKILY